MTTLVNSINVQEGNNTNATQNLSENPSEARNLYQLML